MRRIVKKLVLRAPLTLRKNVVLLRERYWQLRMKKWERKNYPDLPEIKHKRGPVKNILIYQITGMTHGGTEKNLQLIANGLVNSYNVFFMYGETGAESNRVESFDPKVELIPFSYKSNDVAVPHRLSGMKPHIKEITSQYDIDLIITATPGYAHYPWNIITEVPLVISNVFGAPTLQKNIVSVIYNSETTKKHAEEWIGPDPRGEVMYAPLFNLPPENTHELGQQLRSQLGIKATDFMFGRIGRDDNAIFDPVGIRAWQQIAENNPDAHYIIMSPPPALVEIVTKENIPRVHFLPPSSKEKDVWAFHGALNCFAHFRFDGETSGVAIAESLTIGNPVISHRSHLWNAHLEYLSPSCSRIADKDDTASYADYMQEFIDLYRNEPATWQSLCVSAKETAQRFDPEKYKAFMVDLVRKL